MPEALLFFLVFLALLATPVICLLSFAVRDWVSLRPDGASRPSQHQPPPIDLVITWVNRQDPAWAAKYQQALAASQGIVQQHDPPEPGPLDDRTLDVYYAVKSAAQNLPWIRSIILFTQRPQTPSWVHEFPQLRVVHHDEAFAPDTFNGMVTTAHVSEIPQLSEHYIQMDDDVFIVKPLPPAYFFDDAGRPLLRPQASPAFPIPSQGLYGRINNNTRALLRKRLKKLRVLMACCNHRPRACTRTLVQRALESISPSDWQRLQPIRSVQDFDFLGLYLTDYLIHAHRTEIRLAPDDAAQPDADMLSPDYHTDRPIVCINNVFNDEARIVVERLLLEGGRKE